MALNHLYYGDNLDVLRQHLASESVDLIYLDPPFNSNAQYNVIFQSSVGVPASAQIHAFDDTWIWTTDVEIQYKLIRESGASPYAVVKFLEAMRSVLGANDMMAYLVMMAPRLVELRRVLKLTGSIYLHCDPTSSHYLKMLMDAVFGTSQFRNECIWYYKTGGASKRWFAKKHDTLLFYSKSDKYVFYPQKEKSYLAHKYGFKNVTIHEDEDGPYTEVTMRDVWDIPALRGNQPEKLGYPTQKPIALLRRVIESSCPPGGVVLDPFCGCGTAVDAAEELARSWIGIDITYIAIDLIRNRLITRYGKSIVNKFVTDGVPEDLEGARALAKRNKFDFERWAVSLVGGQPNEKQVGDEGIDGRIRFVGPNDDKAGEAIVSVKGGSHLEPSYVQALAGAIAQHHADMGILVTLASPTRGMKDAAAKAGLYEHPRLMKVFPKVQIITTGELLTGKRLDMPSAFAPYRSAARAISEAKPLF